MFHKPDFDDMRQDRIGGQHDGEHWPVELWQGDEAQCRSCRGEGEGDADGADDHRCGHERRTGAALDEGDLGRSNYMNDESLCQKRFDEPAGLEQRGV